jgi:hypothetical protein
LQCWQNLLGLGAFFGTRNSPGLPECFLELPLAAAEAADASFAFALLQVAKIARAQKLLAD